MERMSITRALAEKKLLGNRIAKQFSQLAPIRVVIGDNVPAGFKSVKEFENDARSSYDSIRDELARYDRITQAIAESNAVTTVEIDGVQYTVARALEKKKFYATIGAQYLTSLKRFFLDKEKEYARLTEEEKAKEDAEFDSFVGKDKGLKEEELKVTRKIISERHKVHFLDPLELRKVIEKMEKEQSGFLMNVDIALTESNSKTEIEV
ncbi:MAG: hypothetical protein K2H64_10350 [Desulfovibrio sp.]|nr:hypothetical protein [Desulfovibrio sp.]